MVDHCLRSRVYVSVIVPGKALAPQWLNMNAAVRPCSAGLGIWGWAGNHEGDAPDVLMACAGGEPTLETLAAVDILRMQLPEFKVRVVTLSACWRCSRHQHIRTGCRTRHSIRSLPPTGPSSSRSTAIRGRSTACSTSAPITKTFTCTVTRKKAPRQRRST